MKLRHGFANLVNHLIFTTAGRRPLIVDLEREQFLARLIVSKSRELDVYVYGFGAAEDHLHILFSPRPSLAPERYIHDIKGAFAWVWNKEHGPDWGHITWQDGYWIQSVTPAGFEVLRAYVQRQREHHATRNLMPVWEAPAA